MSSLKSADVSNMSEMFFIWSSEHPLPPETSVRQNSTKLDNIRQKLENIRPKSTMRHLIFWDKNRQKSTKDRQIAALDVIWQDRQNSTIKNSTKLDIIRHYSASNLCRTCRILSNTCVEVASFASETCYSGNTIPLPKFTERPKNPSIYRVKIIMEYK